MLLVTQPGRNVVTAGPERAETGSQIPGVCSIRAVKLLIVLDEVKGLGATFLSSSGMPHFIASFV